jgi:site-specific recombinase XerD
MYGKVRACFPYLFRTSGLTMATKIDSVTARDHLKPRREPYWHRVSKGYFLGLRKMTAGSAGSWIARAIDKTEGKQVYKALGDFGDKPGNQRFDAANKAAQEWFAHLGRGGSTDTSTVAAACQKYAEHLLDSKGETAAEEAKARFRRHVLSDRKLAGVEVAKLTPAHIEAWRKALRDKPTPTGPNKGKKRSASAVNRDMNTFRAALNLAYRDGLATSNFAWRAKLAPNKNADRRRDVYLDIAQRRKLIEAAAPDMADFLRALSLVPLRPGALAALTAGSFDKRLGVLTIGKDKAGGDRKISLPDGTAKFFAKHCKDKLPAAPIFTNAAGRPWAKDTWGYHFGQAAKLAKLPPKATTYSVRHSTITDLIHAGVPSLTVAQLSGTSIAMIESNYGHLTRDHARTALAHLVL